MLLEALKFVLFSCVTSTLVTLRDKAMAVIFSVDVLAITEEGLVKGNGCAETMIGHLTDAPL